MRFAARFVVYSIVAIIPMILLSNYARQLNHPWIRIYAICLAVLFTAALVIDTIPLKKKS